MTVDKYLHKTSKEFRNFATSEENMLFVINVAWLKQKIFNNTQT